MRRRGLDAVTRRAQVGALRKARLMCAALYAAMQPAGELAYAPLPETQFLVDAVEPPAIAVRDAVVPNAAARDAVSPGGARASQQSHAEWLIELFERLQRRDQLASLDPGASR